MALNPAALPMAEAVKFWDDKVPMSDAAFKALSADARTRAFAVSGLSAQAQVEAVHAAIRDAVAKGESFKDFQGRVGELLKAQGWGSWRAETIYRTNVQQAYQAGRYAQMRAAAKARPFWRYVAVRDGRTRPSHLALHNLVYPHDHPFWDQFYPPNGFNCRCTVQSLTEAQVKERGLAIQEDMPELIEPVDPVTGERLPPLRPAPDAGFGGNAGRTWLAGLTPEMLSTDDFVLLSARSLCRDGKALFADDVCKPPLAEMDKRHILNVKQEDLLPADWSKERQVLAFLEEFGVRDALGETTFQLRTGHVLPISAWLFKEKVSGEYKLTWKDKGPYMRLLARTVREPYEAWQSPALLPTGKEVESLRLIRMFSLDGRTIGGYAAWHLLANGTFAAATAFAPKAARVEKSILDYIERLRVGDLLYRERLD